MSESAQIYQKLLTDAIRKQMIILGPQMTRIKVQNIKGLTVADDGTAEIFSQNPQEIITQFLEAFRDLSIPLVKKTMQPLLSVIGTSTTPAPQTQNETKNSAQTEVKTEKQPIQSNFQ